MKVFMGLITDRIYVFDPSLFDEVLRRVREYDDTAKEGLPFKPGTRTIMTEAKWSSETRRLIRNRYYDLTGVHVPTAEEVEADANRQPAKATIEAKPAKAQSEPKQYQPARIPPPVRGLTPVKPPQPTFVVSLWHPAMMAA